MRTKSAAAPIARPNGASAVRLPDRSLTRRSLVWLAAILAIAVAVRGYRLTSRALWDDEFCSLECAAGRGLAHEHLPAQVVLRHPIPALTRLAGYEPWYRVWGSMNDDNHPPGYFVVLRLWRSAVGDSDLALRSLSVVCSVAAVALVFDAVRLSLGTEVALWVAAAMAVAGPQVNYAQQVRNYAPVMLFAAAVASAAVRIEHRGPTRRRLATLAAASVGCAMCHYYGVAPPLAVGLYAVLQFRGRTRLLTLGALTVAAAVTAATLGPVLIHQAHAVADNNAWELDRYPHYARRALARAGSILPKLLNEPIGSRVPAAYLLAMFYLVPLFLVRRRRELLFWYVWLVVPIDMVLAIDVHRRADQLAYARYVLAATPGLFALLVALPPPSAIRTRRAIGAAIAGVGLLLVPWFAPKLPDHRRLARLLAADVGPGDVLVVGGTGPSGWRARCFEMAISHYAGSSFGGDLMILDRPATPAALAALRGYRTCWVAVPREVNLPDLLPTARPVAPAVDVPNTARVVQVRLAPVTTVP